MLLCFNHSVGARPRRLRLFAAIVLLSCAAVRGQGSERQAFAVPADAAERALKIFSTQSGRTWIADGELLRGVRTAAVQGEMTPQEAIERMLTETGLVATFDATTGSFSLRRAAPVVAAAAAARSPSLKPDPAAPGRDELVTLSPFEVNTDKDFGYLAENTLAGSRLNTKLADTPSSVSVFTREFLDDLGATDFRQIAAYTVNSEVSSDVGQAGSFQNAYVNAANLNGAMVTRSMSASQGLDYFTSVAPSDAYRVGRYEDSRGPNSILFGVGPSGGLLNQTSKVAQLTKDTATLRYSLGSWSRHRAELDANKVLRPGVLSLSLAGVDQHNGGWRQFDYQDRRRAFASVSFRPTKRISLTAMGETGRDRAAGLRMMTETEEMLAWFDNRAALGVAAVTATPNAVQPTAAQRAVGIVTLNGARTGTNHRAVMIENDGTVFDAVGTFLSGTYNNNTVRAPDGTAGVTGTALRLNDPKLYPYSMNAGGGGMYRAQSLSNYTLSADFELAPKLFLNLAHNYQRTDLTVNFMTGFAPVLRGDPNRTLGVGGPVNPYAGRLYFDGEWNRDTHFRDYKESRAGLSYTVEPKAAWLGRHRVALMASQTGENDLRTLSWLVLAGHPFTALPTSINNRITIRNYLTEGNYSTYRAGDWRSLPTSMNFAGTNYRLVFANNAGGSGTNGGAFQNTNTQLAVVQSYFFGDRLVTTLGLRRDRVRIEEFGFKTDADVGDVVDTDPAKRTRNWFIGKTNTLGAVWHVREQVSLVGNFSTNVGVPSFSRTVFPDGRLGDPSRGKGSDVGVAFNLLGGRLNAKLVAFNSGELNATGGFTADVFFDQRNVRVMDAFAGALVGPGRPYTAADWAAIYRSLTPDVSGAISDFKSHGYEARLTGNLTERWRVMVNYSYTDARRSNLFNEVIAWYGLKLDGAHTVKQGASQNAAGNFVVDPSAYVAGGTIAKWLELGAKNSSANPSTLTTGTGLTVAREIYNLVDDINTSKTTEEQRWGLRPHKASVFTAYDFRADRLKGFSIGGGGRWRSANVIGADSSGRELRGVSIWGTDFMLRYAVKPRRLPGRFTFQLNVNNVFNKTDIIPQRLANADGFLLPGGRGPAYSRFDLVDPREFRFTTTWSY